MTNRCILLIISNERRIFFRKIDFTKERALSVCRANGKKNVIGRINRYRLRILRGATKFWD